MRGLFIIAAFSLLLLLIPGCIHLTKESDCTGIDGQDEKNSCYFDAAVAYAIIGQDSSKAAEACYKVEGTTFGNERDQCFRRIAAIMQDPAMCYNIQPSILEDGASSYVVRRLCESEATPRGEAACTSLFMIAPLFAVSLFSWSRKG